MSRLVDRVPAEALERHAARCREVKEPAFLYYVLDQPTVSDAAYDAAMREVTALEDGGGKVAASCRFREHPRSRTVNTLR